LILLIIIGSYNLFRSGLACIRAVLSAYICCRLSSRICSNIFWEAGHDTNKDPIW